MLTSKRSATRNRLGQLLTRATAAAVLCAAALTSVPAAVQAQTRTNVDAAGDMVVLDGETYSPAPERRLNDVRSTTLTHGATRLQVVVRYADLAKTNWQALYVQVNTNEAVRRNVFLDVNPPQWAGEIFMFNGGITTVPCSIRHRVDYDANTMSVSFPRRCASSPRWVRFTVASISDEGELIYFDDALSDAPDNDQNWTRSPRVYRQR